MWTEEEVRDYTRKQVDKHFYISASTVVLRSNYIAETGWRFEKMRSIVDHEIQVYKQLLKKKTA